MGLIEVLNPTAEARVLDLPLACRLTDLRGKTIGFLNNRKANARLLLEQVEELLHARFGEFTVIKGDKNASLGVPEAVRNRLSSCDAIITAVGD